MSTLYTTEDLLSNGGVSIWHFASLGEFNIPTHKLSDRSDFVTTFRVLQDGRYLSLHVLGQATPTLLALVSAVKDVAGNPLAIEWKTTAHGKTQKQLGGDWSRDLTTYTTFDPTTGRSRQQTVSA